MERFPVQLTFGKKRMTLQDVFDQLSANPTWVLLYFIFLLVTAILAGLIGKGEGDQAPWKYLYSALLYLVCIPGIFAVTLIIYQTVLNGRNIMETGLVTEILPIAAMFLTIYIIKRNVDLDAIPGFGKLSGLVIIISVALIAMWIIDKTRLIIFTGIRFSYVLLFLAGLLILLRVGLKRLGR